MTSLRGIMAMVKQAGFQGLRNEGQDPFSFEDINDTSFYDGDVG